MPPPIIGTQLEPWLAVNLAAFIPGLGHIYAGRVATGALLAALQVAAVVACVTLAATPGGSMPLFFALVTLLAVNLLGSMWLAHGAVARANPPAFEASRRAAKDPWRAAFWSRLWPGIGHLYLRRWGPGLAWLVSPFAAGVVVSLAAGSGRGATDALSLLATPLLQAGAAFHAWSLAPAGRRDGRRTIMLLAAGIVASTSGASLLTLALRSQVVQAFRIPSGSMTPTLVPGDFLFVSKARGMQIERGDVVVYRYPRDPTKDFVHRVVAMPGDEVEIRARRFTVNGVAAVEPYAWHADSADAAAVEHRDEFGPLKLAEDEYFILGDHRDNSLDSRFFGPVRREAILGRATNRYWPPSRWGAVR